MVNFSIRNRLIHLHRARGTSRPLIRKIMQLDPTLSAIYTLTPAKWQRYFRLTDKRASAIYQDLQSDTLLHYINNDLNNYGVITIVDEQYPPVLKTIKDAPIVLYAIGNEQLLHHRPALSVIGTRKPSPQAWHKIKYIVQPIIEQNWLIVSGMAKGIDSLAHQLALMNNGKTIAVLGSGFEQIYPKENVKLFARIAERGLLLSEYPPNTPPRPYHFPERNRIISGLGFGTLVIEAALKSGTLITVDQALDQGREVYAVPGSPLIRQTEGCHKIIQEGAKLAYRAEDILEDWRQFGHLQV
ncbi:DNA-processing protein DprA [Virgibacillus sp. 179-BFC.A HS]|uniref:DNA-processing protein DprA n=1 Tax=Tigheibacillus jepli TaxID=3035914 RepID=A0ABU5CK76_9BACI|nr:DNA-processing protein DprA [Virgibacillus sp. 179-BFC.A HS]MDY0405895.1 DNA-processing protein DprA [Virgibacillus sp. 179-BFC.A HS]